MFFEGIISNPMVGTLLSGIVNVIGVYIALKLINHQGRRTLLTWSISGMIGSLILITMVLCYPTLFPSILALLAMLGFVCFFEIGLGPVAFLIVAEMFDAKYVATAMSVAVQLNWFSNFLVGLTFPYQSQLLGSCAFVPNILLLAATNAYVLTCLPETAGRTVEEIMAEVSLPTEEEWREIVVEGAEFPTYNAISASPARLRT